jgi:hypothetical protein
LKIQIGVVQLMRHHSGQQAVYIGVVKTGGFKQCLDCRFERICHKVPRDD